MVKHWLFSDIGTETVTEEHLKKHLIHHHPPWISPQYELPHHWVFRDLPPKKQVKLGTNLTVVILSVASSLIAQTIFNRTK